MLFIWCLPFLASSSIFELSDGETQLIDSENEMGSEKVFKFHVNNVTIDDLVVSLTTYSDYSDPDMFLSIGHEPTPSSHDYESFSWGSGSIIIPPENLISNEDYYILVICYTYCRYGITVSYSSEIVLRESIPIDGALTSGKQAIYKFTPGSKNGNIVKITLSQVSGAAVMFVSIGEESEPTSDNSEDVDMKWDGSFEYTCHEFDSSTVFKVAVMAVDDISYTVMAKASSSQAVLIQESVPIQGEVGTGDFMYYYINVLSPNDTISVSLTMFTGDGDIYVRAGGLPTENTFNFSSTHMGNENLVISGVDRKRIGSPTGKYYIGIYGYHHASFTLIVTTSNSSLIELQPGIPQSGAVNQSLFEYYFLKFPSKDTNITISLSVGSGNPDLYIKLCTKDMSKCFFNKSEIANPLNIYYSSHLTGGESIDIPHKKSSCPANSQCNYIIGVYGISTYSTFTIAGTTNRTDEMILREGRPISSHLSIDDFRYYKFTVINNTVYEVIFMLTPTYGDCDIFACFNSYCSIDNLDMFDKFSYNYGAQIDQISYIRGADSESLVGTYHIMVYANDDTSFSIVAKERVPGKNTTIQIYPGHPQKDTLFNDPDRSYRIYFFPIHFTQETKQDIIITLTGITGNFSVYVANQLSNLDWKNEIFYYNWRNDVNSNSDPHYIIRISTKDYWYKLDSTYLILVMGEKFLADNTSTYVVGLTCGDGNLILAEDVPYTGMVMMDQYNYYSFPIHYKHEDVTISITAMSGDPDMFISVNPYNNKPTAENYDFKSSTFGSEFLTLVWEEGLRDKCPSLPDEYEFGDKTECNIYIGVYGFETSTYVIRVHPSTILPMVLTLGQPMNGNVNISSYSFYYAIVDASYDLHIDVQPILGDSDLYVNILDSKTAGKMSEWKRPTRIENDYASQSAVMSEEIEIPISVMNSTCRHGSCLVLAAVYCISQVCTYSITIRQSEVQMLIENQANYGSVSSGYMYYSYYCDKDFTNFMITITSFGDGNPDVYISKGRDTRPNSSFFNWASTKWGSDNVLITSDDEYFKGNSMKGTYVIGITSNFGPSSYSIMINNNIRPVIALNSGIPQYGNATNILNYYSFYNVMHQDIIISITPILGQGKFYVKTYKNSEDYEELKLPNNDDNIWSSTKNSDRYSLTIKTNDPNFCVFCDLVIGIQADENIFAYSITASNRLNITVLQNGIVTKCETSGGKWNVFSFEVLKSADIDISLAPFSGSPSIYVSTSKDITNETFVEDYLWVSYFVEDAVTISISKDDKNFKIGTYYISVESRESTTFTIVAHTKEVPVSLIDGWPVSYALRRSSDDYVQMRLVVKSGNNAFCTLRSLGDFYPSIYVNFQEPLTKYLAAGPQNYTRMFNESDYEKNYNQLIISLPHEYGKSQLNLGIYSYENHENANSGKFQIWCSGTTQPTVLRVGTMSIEMITKDMKAKRYEMVTPSKGTLDTYIIPCIGSVMLEISSNWTLFMQDNPDVKVYGTADGMTYGTISNANGRYFISVSATNETKENVQIYEFLTVFTKHGDPVYKSFTPGNNGLLTWELKDRRKISVSWHPVQNESGPVINSGVEYKIFFTQEKPTDMISSCTIYFKKAEGQIKLLGSTTETTLEVEIPHDKGFINIIASLPKSSVSPLKEIVYDPTEVLLNGPPPHSGKGLLIFWVLAILLLISVATSVYFYKKKKRVENVLNYEMNDVRNVASIPVPGEEKAGIIRKDPYSSLAEVN